MGSAGWQELAFGRCRARIEKPLATLVRDHDDHIEVAFRACSGVMA
jgi:hypothetical protein